MASNPSKSIMGALCQLKESEPQLDEIITLSASCLADAMGAKYRTKCDLVNNLLSFVGVPVRESEYIPKGKAIMMLKGEIVGVVSFDAEI